MLLFFSCQELVNNDQQRALTSRTPPRESSKSPTRAVSWVNRLFCSETDCTQFDSLATRHSPLTGSGLDVGRVEGRSAADRRADQVDVGDEGAGPGRGCRCGDSLRHPGDRAREGDRAAAAACDSQLDELSELEAVDLGS